MNLVSNPRSSLSCLNILCCCISYLCSRLWIPNSNRSKYWQFSRGTFTCYKWGLFFWELAWNTDIILPQWWFGGTSVTGDQKAPFLWRRDEIILVWTRNIFWRMLNKFQTRLISSSKGQIHPAAWWGRYVQEFIKFEE